MTRFPRLLVACLLLAAGTVAADDAFRVLSWNISGTAHERKPATFESILRWADADLLLFDEVSHRATARQFEALLGDDWSVHVGTSGGRQVQLIATRGSLETLPEFEDRIEYPEPERAALEAVMTRRDKEFGNYSMEGGIPVSGAIVSNNDKRLLVVITDLQCCGDSPQSWQETRRRVEARVIRDLIRRVLQREPVDGVILAGDFNLVNGGFALSILGGPFEQAPYGLSQVEIYHQDGKSAWTWDGRNTPFPNGTLDFQMYSPASLSVEDGLILDTEQADEETLDRYELSPLDITYTGRHRPLVVEYAWR